MAAHEQQCPPVEFPGHSGSPRGGCLRGGRGAGAIKPGIQADAVALFGDVHTHQVTHGGQKVHILGGNVQDRAVPIGAAGVHHHGGDAVGPLMPAQLAEQSVVTKQLAVIGGDDHHGVRIQAT